MFSDHLYFLLKSACPSSFIGVFHLFFCVFFLLICKYFIILITVNLCLYIRCIYLPHFIDFFFNLFSLSSSVWAISTGLSSSWQIFSSVLLILSPVTELFHLRWVFFSSCKFLFGSFFIFSLALLRVPLFSLVVALFPFISWNFIIIAAFKSVSSHSGIRTILRLLCWLSFPLKDGCRFSGSSCAESSGSVSWALAKSGFCQFISAACLGVDPGGKRRDTCGRKDSNLSSILQSSARLLVCIHAWVRAAQRLGQSLWTNLGSFFSDPFLSRASPSHSSGPGGLGLFIGSSGQKNVGCL